MDGGIRGIPYICNLDSGDPCRNDEKLKQLSNQEIL